MSDEAPDANDLLMAGRELIPDGDVVVPLERARAKRGARGGGGEPPPIDDSPHPGDGDGGGDGPFDDPPPTIVVTTEEGEVNDRAVTALARDTAIYVRDGELVRIVPGQASEIREPKPPQISMLPIELVQERLAICARFVKKVPAARDKATGEVTDWAEAPMHPPKWCVGAVAKRGIWPGLRHLEAVVEQPVLRPDGTVLDSPGYDRKSGVYLLAQGEPFQRVPDRPTADELKAALDALDDVVSDMLWHQPAHRSTWLASILTPLARHAFHGPAPLFLFDAPTAGTGKTLCAEVAIRIATGRAAAVSSLAERDEEMDKRILAWSMSGANVVLLDNVSRPLGGDSLCRVLSGTIYESRLLSKSENRSALALMTWFATGNNVALGRDMHRRVAHARILSPLEDPSKRDGFRHPRLKTHVARNQRALLAAALTILRAYCVADRPDQKLASWGSYEEWNAIVRGAIVWAGWPDPYDAVEQLREASSDELGTRRALAQGWAKALSQMGRPASSVRDVVAHVYRADPGPLPDLRAFIDERASKDGRPSVRAIGNLLKGMVGGVFDADTGSLSVRSIGKDRAGSALWAAEWLVGGPGAESAGSAGSAGSGSGPSTRAPAHAPDHSRILDQQIQTQQTQQTQQEEIWGSDDEEPGW